MASGFFAVLDDIGALMDDVAVASKLATRKTAGILGDDLAVNAEKATGFVSDRELPVLWAITKGSLLNKVIIIPVVLALNVFFPAATTYILLAGGCYLAYEGMHKIAAYFFHRSARKAPEGKEAPGKKPGGNEKEKIRSAIATDFILSIEIVIIALGTVLDKSTVTQVLTVSIIAVLATIGVYGIVALIVRMDDAGRSLIEHAGTRKFPAVLGRLLVKALPVVIKILSVSGTIALLLVAGGIFVHNIPFLHHLFPKLPAILTELLAGIAASVVVLAVVEGGKKAWTTFKSS